MNTIKINIIYEINEKELKKWTQDYNEDCDTELTIDEYCNMVLMKDADELTDLICDRPVNKITITR